MSLKPDFLSLHDMPHFGILFRHIRETLGLKQSKLADHISVDVATVNRFEKLGTTQPDTVKSIIAALNAPALTKGLSRHTLTENDIQLLQSIYSSFLEKKTKEIQLAAIDFELVVSSYCPDSLRQQIQKMRSCGFPAFLIDPLWFIHAINGAGLQVFGLDPEAEYMNRWEFWHVLGTKFAKDSPVRTAHASIDDYFPPSVDVFFKSTTPYLFTIQMRSLLSKLHQMSSENSYEFSRSWQSACTFNLPYVSDPRSRKLVYKKTKADVTSEDDEDTKIHVTSEYDAPIRVKFSSDNTISFMLGQWKPVEPESRTQRILEEIWKSPTGSKVFFAADYDRQKTFHANYWPSVISVIEDSLDSA